MVCYRLPIREGGGGERGGMREGEKTGEREREKEKRGMNK